MVTFVVLVLSVLSATMGQLANVSKVSWVIHSQEVSVRQIFVLQRFHVQNPACV